MFLVNTIPIRVKSYRMGSILFQINRNIIVTALMCLVLIAISPTLLLGPGFLTKTGDLTAEPTNGMISVVSVPAGADTFLDGISTSRHSPCLLADISPGSHRVMVSYPGYESKSGSVDVIRGKTAAIKFTLTKVNRTDSSQSYENSGPDGGASLKNGETGTDPGSAAHPSDDSGSDPGSTTPPSDGPESTPDGSILVTSSAPGATIFVNGANTGQITPASHRESPGVYNVSVTLNGFQTPAARTVTVISSQQVTVNFILTPVTVDIPVTPDIPDTPVTPVIPTPEFPSPSFPAIVIAVCAVMVFCIRCRME